METLSLKEKVVLSLTYGLNSRGKILQTKEIADLLGTRPYEVSKIRNSAIMKLKSPKFRESLTHLIEANETNKKATICQ